MEVRLVIVSGGITLSLWLTRADQYCTEIAFDCMKAAYDAGINVGEPRPRAF